MTVESVIGDGSAEKVPADISSVVAVEAWVSALESVAQGRSLHPHVLYDDPSVDA